MPGRRRSRFDDPLGLHPAGGRSLSDIARSEIGPVAGVTAAIAILFIIIIALAGLALAVANALEESAWGTFTLGMSIPLALFMGLHVSLPEGAHR